MRAKNIYSGKKGQGEGTSLEDFIGPVLERGLYTNNMVLKIKKKKKGATKQHCEQNKVSAQPRGRGWMMETPTGASPLEPLPTFHGQEGLCCYLGSPQHFTQPFPMSSSYLAHSLLLPANSSSWEEGDLGVMLMPAALQGEEIR